VLLLCPSLVLQHGVVLLAGFRLRLRLGLGPRLGLLCLRPGSSQLLEKLLVVLLLCLTASRKCLLRPGLCLRHRPLEHLGAVGIGFCLPPGLGFHPGVCQRLRQLRFVLLCLGIRFRLHLGVRLPRGLQHGIRLLLGTCQRLGQLRRVLLLPGVRFCPRPGLRLRPCLRYSLRLRLDQLLGLVRVLRPRPGGGLLPGIRQRLRQPLFVLPP